MSFVQGKEAEDLLNEMMTMTLEKIVEDPDQKHVYLDAFQMILDNEFSGIPTNLKKALSQYLVLKERIYGFNKSKKEE